MEVIFARGEAGHVSFSSLVIVGLMLQYTDIKFYQLVPITKLPNFYHVSTMRLLDKRTTVRIPTFNL